MEKDITNNFSSLIKLLQIKAYAVEETIKVANSTPEFREALSILVARKTQIEEIIGELNEIDDIIKEERELTEEPKDLDLGPSGFLD